MTKPKSRQAEAFEANGWPNEVAEYDPHGVAAGGMYSECADCSSRRNYGPNPWSAPGTARAVDFVMGGSGGNILGVCGASPSRDNDYNTPLDGHWGMSAKTTYKAVGRSYLFRAGQRGRVRRSERQRPDDGPELGRARELRRGALMGSLSSLERANAETPLPPPLLSPTFPSLL